ncbi:MAG: integration host factor subunit alpha [Desulfobacterales bacterium]|jgi:integration host factor subunit alpha
MALTKNALAEAIQAENGLLLKQSREAVETVLDIIKRALAAGDDVLISGFGKFEVREKGARKGRNPATGGELLLRRRKVVTFKISGKLKETLNGGPHKKPAQAPKRS